MHASLVGNVVHPRAVIDWIIAWDASWVVVPEPTAVDMLWS